MDSANRRPQLPALSYLNVDNVKSEESSFQDRKSAAPQTQNSAPAASPSFQYPPHPPPPYNHPPPRHANSWPDANSRVHTPPDSRRTSGEESDGVKAAPRQSLPSISEALGETSFSQNSSSQQSQTQPSHLPQAPSVPPASPPTAGRRSFGMDPPQSHNPYTGSAGYQFASFRQDSAGPPTYPSESAKPGFATPQEGRPPLHVQTSQPQRAQPPPNYPSTSPQYEQPSAQSGSSMGPPTYPYGYTPFPPRFQPSTSSQSAGPIYQPSTQFAAPPTPSPGWKSDGAPSRLDDRSGIPPYGESVKRHLDLYDLESALAEVLTSSNIMQDFARRYGDRVHRDGRQGPAPASLPGIVEVEDMIKKTHIQLESLSKIREVITAQQDAYEQQIAEQRQQKAYNDQNGPPAELQNGMTDKGEFAGPDTKKRRGRAAPPGRCHSCNRAETPEWRRGPDGARTLCNACGLHYAKLTRKQNGANKATTSTSNLRPKES